MKTLVDNFAVLSIEECLISHLGDMLTPDVIENISAVDIESIAAESEISKADRQQNQTKLDALQQASKTLRSYGHGRSFSKFFSK